MMSEYLYLCNNSGWGGNGGDDGGSGSSGNGGDCGGDFGRNGGVCGDYDGEGNKAGYRRWWCRGRISIIVQYLLHNNFLSATRVPAPQAKNLLCKFTLQILQFHFITFSSESQKCICKVWNVNSNSEVL